MKQIQHDEGPSKSPANITPEMMRSWVQTLGNRPLLVVSPNDAFCSAMKAHAELRGFSVVIVGTAKETSRQILRRRPMAILCDEKLPDGNGRDILAGLRCDFRAREIPVALVSMAQIDAKDDQAVDAVFKGVEGMLRPACGLFHYVKSDGAGAHGIVERIGVGFLLENLAVAGASGYLELARKDEGVGRVWFEDGRVEAVSVDVDGATDGESALADIIGYQWTTFTFSAEKPSVPVCRTNIRDVTAAVATGRRINNALLTSVCTHGTKSEGIVIHDGALDRYLHTLPPTCLQTLIGIVEGEQISQVAQSVGEPLVRSMLHEMRRASALRIASIDVFASAVHAADGAESALQDKAKIRPGRVAVNGKDVSGKDVGRGAKRSAKRVPARKRKRRAPVIVVACILTLVFVAGGVLALAYFTQLDDGAVGPSGLARIMARARSLLGR